MFQGCLVHTADATFTPSFRKWPNSGFDEHTGFWTADISESPNDADEVFVVLSAGVTGGRARTVLFESESRTRGAQARAEAGASLSATLRSRSHSRGVNEPGRGGEDDSNLVAIGVHANQRGELRTSALAGSLTGSKSGKQYEGIMVARPLKSGGNSRHDESHETYVVGGGSYPTVTDDASPTLTGRRGDQTAVIQVASSGERERALTASAYKRHDDDTDTLIAATLTGRGRGATDSVIDNLQVASALTASAGHHGHSSPRGDGRDNLIAEVANTLLSPNGGSRTDDLNQTFTPTRYGVRRLTPLESERVQGFPDGWTCLCGEGHRGSRFCKCPDTPRFKALGNAVTMPVALWIASNLRASLDEEVTPQGGGHSIPANTDF